MLRLKNLFYYCKKVSIRTNASKKQTLKVHQITNRPLDKSVKFKNIGRFRDQAYYIRKERKFSVDFKK